MDPKKQNLTPELKQIYERVMNTPVNSSNPTTSVNTETQPNPAAPVPPPQGTMDQSTQQDIAMPSEPRPLSGISDTKPFVYSSKTMSNPSTNMDGTITPTMHTGKGLSTPILFIGVIVLIVVYGIIWYLVIF